MAPSGLDIYEKVKAKMATGMNTSQACAAVGEELGRTRQSVATTYYRWVKKDPMAPPPSPRRGRPRKSAAPVGTRTPVIGVPAGSDPLAALSAEMHALREENARLRAIVDAVRDAVR